MPAQPKSHIAAAVGAAAATTKSECKRAFISCRIKMVFPFLMNVHFFYLTSVSCPDTIFSTVEMKA